MSKSGKSSKKEENPSSLRFWLLAVGAVLSAVAAVAVNCFGARNPFHILIEYLYW